MTASNVEVIEVLRAARDHIAAPNGWCTGRLRKRRRNAPGGWSCCAMGAVRLYSGTDYVRWDAAITLAEVVPNRDVAKFNDAQSDPAPVVAKFNEAIRSLGGEP